MKRLLSAVALIAPISLLQVVLADTPSKQLGLSEPEAEATLTLPAMDRAKLLLEDDDAFASGRPAHYARPVKLAARRVDLDGGQWQPTGDGRWIWRLTIHAPGATSLDVGLDEVWLPAGSQLYFYDAGQRLVRGPYSDRHNKDHGQLWLPVVPGEKALLELVVPAQMRDHVRLGVAQVNYGFRLFNDDAAKSGSCNVDVICPDGDQFRNQIRSVATYGVGSSSTFCTGQLINNTANDNTPYFLTANHCEIGSGDAASLTVYWNYQSSTCRDPGSVASGTPINIGQFTDVQTGATLVAESTVGGGVVGNDFSLLQLDELPDPSFNVYWTGWDRSGSVAQSATAIHHPLGDEKRISHTLQPLLATAYLSETGGGDSHWRVRAWDTGTTEPGSSGSGLFDPNGRLVGMLSGGFASCSSDPATCTGGTGACDWYGRFSQAFSNGTSSNRRLSDWLDPGGSGQQTLDGINGCDQPVVTLSSSANPASVGETVVFSATISGGAPPYSLSWDLDGDGASDASSEEVTATFPDALSKNVILSVVDSAECAVTTSLGQVIQAPRIEVTGTSDPVEQCGDGDADIEPGEIWAFPVTLQNTGSARLNGGVAAFGISSESTGAITDDFGYSVRDSSSVNCPFDFQDISTTGTQLVPDDVDDGAAPLTLGGPGIDFYGTGLTEVSVTTNGYLSSSVDDRGTDFNNDCPLPAPVSSGGDGRIAVLHDDFRFGDIFHQYFADCPRPGDTAAGAGCNIVQWTGLDYFEGAADATFQGLLYDGSNEIVFQYLSGNPRMGDSQTVGIQNDDASIGLTYACEQAGAVTNQNAVCFFHPASTPAGLMTEGLVIDNPAVSLPNLNAGASTTVNVVVQIEDDFTCGGQFGIDYLGTAHNNGYSNTPQSLIASAQTRGCDSNASCSIASKGQSVIPRDGFWFSPIRPGNGIDLHFIGDQMYSAWYTSEPGRIPVWYYVQTLNDQAVVHGQIRATILRFINEGTPDNVIPNGTVVGEAVFSFLTESVAAMTWTIKGVSNGEKIVFFDLDNVAVDDVITDQWFNAGESGWGLGVHRQGSQEFNALYLYGTDGEPRWVVTLENPLNDDSSDLAAARAHCPGCALVIPTPLLPAGSMPNRVFNTDGTGSISLDISLDGDQPIEWQRTDLPLMQINPPAGKKP